MSLHGTLETFALPDVLALLAATKKTGELRVVGGKTDGRVWFDAGAVVGADVGRSATFVDAVFELLRLESGKFSFDAEKTAPAPAEPAAIDAILGEAQARLAEWKAIEAVIPSVEHGVTLVADVADPHVMVTGEQWRALVAVASSPIVTSVVDRLGIGEFDTCRTLKGLVEIGLVTVGERVAAPAPAPAPAPTPAPAPAPEPVATAPEPVAAVEPEPVAAAVAPEPVPTVAAQLTPEVGASKAKIKALTSTPAADAAALEAVAEPAPTPAPQAEKAEPAPAPAPEPAADPAGEADELVRQVAALDGTAEAAPEAPAPAPAPAQVAEPEAEAVPEAAPEAAVAPAEGEEPINRGLLLKFLSSVRT